MATDGPDRDLTAVEQEIVRCLHHGAETTLLLLEMLTHTEAAEEHLDEARLVEAALALEQDGLLVRRARTDHPPTRGCGIPEWDQGRADTVWWSLSTAGERRLRQLRGW